MTVDRYRELCARHRWNVPHDFNIAAAVCGRHASDDARVAIHWEDESGATTTPVSAAAAGPIAAPTLAALGVGRGDKLAIMPRNEKPDRPHRPCYQLGAVAVPLSFLFGPEALEYRLQNSESLVAIVDPASLPNLAPIRDRLPGLRHVIGVAGAQESWLLDWDRLLQKSSDGFSPVATRAADPAILVYTSGTTGPPKAFDAAAMRSATCGFVYSQMNSRRRAMCSGRRRIGHGLAA
jgi:acetyl-CoA synthetase